MKQSPTNEATQLILNFLFKKGIYAKRHGVTGFSRDNHFYQAGVPGGSDIFAWLPPHCIFLGIELKRGHDKLRPEQEGFIKNIQLMGGGVIVARGESANDMFADFQEQFKTYEAALKVIHTS